MREPTRASADFTLGRYHAMIACAAHWAAAPSLPCASSRLAAAKRRTWHWRIPRWPLSSRVKFEVLDYIFRNPLGPEWAHLHPTRPSGFVMPLITILVEDNPTIRANLIPALKELGGLNVIAVAETAGAAIATLHEYQSVWRLAVVDLFLKEGSGLAVLEAFRARDAHQHMLVLSNYATPDIRRTCLKLGADGVFDKSTELEHFFAQCNAYEQA